MSIIEDALAKNWLQGQLKANGLIFDHSFNSEIIKVKADGLFRVLGQFFDKPQILQFAEAFEKLTAERKGEQLRAGFAKLAMSFAGAAAKSAGTAVSAIVANQLGHPTK